MKNKRDYKLDVLRVISMFMVIFVHVANYYGRAFSSITSSSYLFSVIYNLICRVSVPIFFMISGITLLNKEYDPQKNKKRIINRAITLVFVTVIYYFWDRYFMAKSINILNIIREPERKLLWYMYALISLYIALPFIKCMVNNMGKREDKLFVILWIIFNTLSSFLGIFKAYPVPIINATYYLGYFVIGYIIYKYKDEINYKKYNKYLIIILLVSLVSSVLITYLNSIKLGKFDNSLFGYRLIFTVANSLSSFILIYFNISNVSNKFIEVLSKYSFGVYLFHGIFLDLFMKLIPYKLINSLYGTPIFVFIIFIATFSFVYLIKKIKFIDKYI